MGDAGDDAHMAAVQRVLAGDGLGIVVRPMRDDHRRRGRRGLVGGEGRRGQQERCGEKKGVSHIDVLLEWNVATVRRSQAAVSDTRFKFARPSSNWPPTSLSIDMTRLIA